MKPPFNFAGAPVSEPMHKYDEKLQRFTWLLLAFTGPFSQNAHKRPLTVIQSHSACSTRAITTGSPETQRVKRVNEVVCLYLIMEAGSFMCVPERRHASNIILIYMSHFSESEAIREIDIVKWHKAFDADTTIVFLFQGWSYRIEAVEETAAQSFGLLHIF